MAFSPDSHRKGFYNFGTGIGQRNRRCDLQSQFKAQGQRDSAC